MEQSTSRSWRQPCLAPHLAIGVAIQSMQQSTAPGSALVEGLLLLLGLASLGVGAFAPMQLHQLSAGDLAGWAWWKLRRARRYHSPPPRDRCCARIPAPRCANRWTRKPCGRSVTANLLTLKLEDVGTAVVKVRPLLSVCS